ncbi:MAG: pirin family protein [Burkholderiales bacterium]
MNQALAMPANTILETAPLGFQWPCIDPFLFCVHHVDHYPAGNAQMGPSVSLAGRNIGQDFEGKDGWRMYHGQSVPGFPQHPHRGFETVTIVRRGLIDHADSLGAAARFGAGDVQWLTAGGGIVHSEMFPLLDRSGPNTLELFQIWLNLPAEDKMVAPHFTMLWDRDIPRITHTDEAGRATTVTVVAGTLDGRRAPAPPPHSWASRADTDLAIWCIAMSPHAQWTLPAALCADTMRALYFYGGGSVSIDQHQQDAHACMLVRSDRAIALHAGAKPCDLLLLQSRPIAEPVAQHGPFVMNDRAGIEQAFHDYRRTQFGGWPWGRDDPVHAREEGRFARHADGRIERL